MAAFPANSPGIAASHEGVSRPQALTEALRDEIAASPRRASDETIFFCSVHLKWISSAACESRAQRAILNEKISQAGRHEALHALRDFDRRNSVQLGIPRHFVAFGAA
jgi:hypothetical protein